MSWVEKLFSSYKHHKPVEDPKPDKKKELLDKSYCRIALEFAARSKDPKTKVGALIVTQEGILYPGYNGDEAGGSNKRDSLESGNSGFIHAEENAIIKFNPTIHKDSVMYLSHAPCKMCARRIINTHSIRMVYYANEFREMDGAELLRTRGIHCEKIEV